MKMKKYIITFNTEMEIEALNEDEALDIFWEDVMSYGEASLEEIDESEE